MKKLMVAAAVAACAANALAMPTKAELTKAQPLVAELMAPAMAEFKAAAYKEKSAAAVKVGDASSEFAKAAETEAAKFLLLKGAVSFYVRGEQYDKAADTVAALQREVKDVPPAVIAEITGKEAGKISESKAPRLYALYRSAKLQVRAADEAKALAAKLKKVQSDALRRKYAEALAVSGDWKAAYAEFAKVSDAKLKEIAASVTSANVRNADAGEFWWAYVPAMKDAEGIFKAHAAAFYSLALAAGEIAGLRKNLIRQRIADIPDDEIVVAFPPFGGSDKSKDDIVYELRIMDIKYDGGTAWSYMDKAPVVDMAKFSTTEYAGEGLKDGRTPLSAENGWEGGKTEYWVRKEFLCPVEASRLSGGYLLVDADKTVEIWLNGKMVNKVGERSYHYFLRALNVDCIKQGRNVIAAHVQIPSDKKTGFCDLGLYLQGRGLYGYAKLLAGNVNPLIPVDIKSLSKDTAAVKCEKHGGAEWKYTTVKPQNEWFDSAFDDSGWATGTGGFAGGSRPNFAPFSKAATKWDTDDIWMRTVFDYSGKNISQGPSAVLCFARGLCQRHPKSLEQIVIYLNGKMIHENSCLAKTVESSYWDVYDITDKVRPALVKGKNTLAVYARVPPPGLRFWARFVDVGLYIK